MGQCADSYLVYGILFDEDTEFPWNAEEYEDDVEDWWMGINNFQFNWRTDGFEKKHAWLKENPVPVEVINYVNYDYPAYILTDPELIYMGSWGVPKEIDFNDSEKWNPVFLAEKTNKLLDFCKKYDIILESRRQVPKWWLAAFYG